MHLRARTVLLVSAALAIMASSAAPALAAPWPALSPATAGDQALTWSIVPSPNAIAIDNILFGVSCASVSNCTAVGWHVHTTKSPSKTLIESWNGTTWSVVSSRNPRSESSLGSVSCVSASDCTAVGSDSGARMAPKTLVESWNGTTWTVVPSPNAAPHRRGINELMGVSCASVSACTAVGSYVARNGRAKTLIESWNGTAWSIVPSPNPGPAASSLGSVSCASATACTAVGSYLMRKGGGRVVVTTLVESWNGTAWSIVPSPSPGPAVSALQGVSCATATACTAVGYSQTRTRAPSSALIESWDGTTWSVVPSPLMTGRLSRVSCASATACTAVGFSASGTLIESWDGTTWSVASSPSKGSDSGLADVSCLPAATCTAVGTYIPNVPPHPEKTLIEAGSPSGAQR